MKVVGWVVAAVLLFLVVLGAGENQRASARHARVADSLRAVSDAALFSLDTIKARSAEREIGDQKHADSLRRVIATARNRPPITLRDTVESYVFITDSVIPKCVVCAARLDSAVVAARAEREAVTLVIASQKTEIDYWVAHDKPHHSTLNRLRDRLGLFAGYSLVAGPSPQAVTRGFSVGIGLRLWP